MKALTIDGMSRIMISWDCNWYNVIGDSERLYESGIYELQCLRINGRERLFVQLILQY